MYYLINLSAGEITTYETKVAVMHEVEEWVSDYSDNIESFKDNFFVIKGDMLDIKIIRKPVEIELGESEN
jgi:hypothetical protein